MDRSADDSAASDQLAQLLARVALSDRAAFEDLYRLTRAKLFGVLLRMLNRAEQAEDVLQEVYVKVWRNATDYQRSQARPMTWLLTITRNSAIDSLRRERLRTAEGLTDEPGDASAGPGQRAEQLLQSQRLARCLGQLPAAQRACIALAYVEGYTHDELSRRLGSPIGTIKSWIRRGLKQLRDCLQP